MHQEHDQYSKPVSLHVLNRILVRQQEPPKAQAQPTTDNVKQQVQKGTTLYRLMFNDINKGSTLHRITGPVACHMQTGLNRRTPNTFYEAMRNCLLHNIKLTAVCHTQCTQRSYQELITDETAVHATCYSQQLEEVGVTSVNKFTVICIVIHYGSDATVLADRMHIVRHAFNLYALNFMLVYYRYVTLITQTQSLMTVV